MRHGASLLVSLEGMSRAAFRIARELSNNSRSGLTVRFLSKKLELAEEEIEYLLDVNHRLLFTDLTKIKLVAEGYGVVKRIGDGLENRGDIASLLRIVRGLTPHEFRKLEEQIGLDQPAAKKMAAEELISRYYQHPDSIVTYVATRGFSQTAREIFDIIWQAKSGIMPISQIRVAHGGSEFEVEQGLWELMRGFAVFELFRFDAEDRLVRAAGLLSEVRQWRESSAKSKGKRSKVKPAKAAPDYTDSLGIDTSENICRLVAAIAARPARLRGDGDLFREDRRRLGEIVAEEGDPSLSTCLWAAEGLGLLARVDDELRAGQLDKLLPLDRVARHRVVYDWFAAQGDITSARKLFVSMLEDVKPGQWFSTLEFITSALEITESSDQPILKQSGGHWLYLSPSASGQWESRLARALEEVFFWLGVINRGTVGKESFFQLTELGQALLTGDFPHKLQETYPLRKGEFVVQPNFDIVVPTGDMDPLLTVPLDQFAVRQSTGQATVYHVGKESFTQAIQDGHSGDAFVDFLMRHNRGGGLPLNVTTTLEDWRGAIKRVKLHTISILESEDSLVIADLIHRRKFQKFLATIDPQKTLVYTDISKQELAKQLEKDGFIVE